MKHIKTFAGGGSRARHGLGRHRADAPAPRIRAPAAYAKALKGKHVMLVPMAMGFDLAQGWTAILKREVDGLRRHLRDARPELEHRCRRPGDHRRDLVGRQAGRAGRHVVRPELLFQAAEEGPEGGHLRHPDRQPGQLRGRRLCRRRLEPARPAGGRGRRSRAAATTRPRRSAWCRATRPTPPASTSMPASWRCWRSTPTSRWSPSPIPTGTPPPRAT